MKNIAFNTKKKWLGSLEGTLLGEQGTTGSYLREDDDRQASLAATRLLTDDDHSQRLDKAIRNPYIRPVTDSRAPSSSRRVWANNVDSFLCA